MSTAVASRPLPTETPNAGGNEFDDLLNYDAGDVNDPFSENYISEARKEREAREAAEKKAAGDVLGLDEQLDLPRKPRAPRVKLDEERLLSDGGIKKLQQRAKKHLKFKGRGHEFSDMANLLSFYQIWLDDVFPKGKFLDSLVMVEKMGHKKRIQMARQEWIDEGKPKLAQEEDDPFDEPTLPRREDGERDKAAPRVAPIFEKKDIERPKTPTMGVNADMEDLYDATPLARRQNSPAPAGQTGSLFGGGGGSGSLFGPAKHNGVDDEEFPDDLDALLAEDEAMQVENGAAKASEPAKSGGVAQQDDFDDEMEALAGMDWEG